MAVRGLFDLTEIRVSSAQYQQTTPNSHRSLQKVTIVHPFHPLDGQQVPVVRIHKKEPEPELLVQLPDGSHTLIEPGLTDYALQTDGVPLVCFSHLLDFDGLCQMARMVDRLLTRQQDHDNLADDD